MQVRIVWAESVYRIRLNYTDIGKKAWLYAKLQPGRARKRINATQEAPFYRALYILGWVKNVVHARKRTKLVWVMFQNRVRTKVIPGVIGCAILRSKVMQSMPRRSFPSLGGSFLALNSVCGPTNFAATARYSKDCGPTEGLLSLWPMWGGPMEELHSLWPMWDWRV